MFTKKFIYLFLIHFFFTEFYAQISADKGLGCAPVSVIFSPPTGMTTYYWDFGNGQSSQSANPSALFNTASTTPYQITLRACATCPIVATYSFPVYPKPTITLSSQGKVNDNIALNPAITLPPGVTITSTTVTSGNGQSANAVPANFQYTNPGRYNSGVEIKTSPSNAGCDVSVSIPNAVKVSEFKGSIFPVFSILCLEPFSTNFVNSTSSHFPIVSYRWDFGNGNLITSSSPSLQTYPDIEKIYDVNLEVMDNNQQSNTYSTTVEVKKNNTTKILDPKVNGKISDTACVNVPISFDRDGKDDLTNLWTFPGGSPTNSSLKTASTVFISPGAKQIQLKTSVNNLIRCEKSFSKTVQVLDIKPKIKISGAPFCNKVNSYSLELQETHLYDSVHWIRIPEGKIIGKGFTINVNNDTIKYDTIAWKIDSQFIRARCFTRYGCEIEKDSYAFYPLIAHWAPDTILKGCAPLKTKWIDKTPESGHPFQLSNWKVDFGDGSPILNLNSFNSPIYHTYNLPGIYWAKIIVTNSKGCIDTSYHTQVQVGASLSPSFTINNIGCASNPSTQIDLNNTTTPSSLVQATKFWSDGFQCYNQNTNNFKPTKSAGTTNIVLETGNNWCLKKTSQSIYIPGTIADFQYSYDCSIPLQVKFFDSSKNATNYFWEFGDGQTSTLKNPIHNYLALGNYAIKLTTSNSDVCPQSTIIKNVRIPDSKIEIKDSFIYKFHQNAIVKNIFATLTNAASSDINPVPFLWKFKDSGLFLAAPIRSQFSNTFFPKLDSIFYHDFEVVYTNSLGCEIKDYAFFANDSITQVLTKIFPDSNSICAKDTLIFQTNINSFFEIDSIVWTFSTGDTFKIHVKDSLNKYLDNKLKLLSTLGAKKYISILSSDEILYRDTFIKAIDDNTFWNTWNPKNHILLRSLIKNKLQNTSVKLSDLELRGWNRRLYSALLDTINDFLGTKEYVVPKNSSTSKLKVSTKITNKYRITDSASIELDYKNLNPRIRTKNKTICYAPDSLILIDTALADFPSIFKWKFTKNLISNKDSFEGNQIEIKFKDTGKYDYFFIAIDSSNKNCTDTFKDQIRLLFKPDLKIRLFNQSLNNFCAPYLSKWYFEDTLKTSILRTTIRWNIFNNSNIPVINSNYNAIDTLNETLQRGRNKITLIASNGSCIDTAEYILNVYKPKGIFTIDTNNICKGDDIVFTIKDTSDVDTFEINFGDGYTSQMQSPIRHTYNFVPIGGKTSAKASFKSPGGFCSIVFDSTIFIHEVASKFVRNFGLDTAFCLKPLHLLDTSLNADSRIWNFGDGNISSTFQNDFYLFKNPGTYDISLRVKNNQYGCTDSISQRVILWPNPTSSPTKDTICVGDTALLFSLNPLSNHTYKWEPSDQIIKQKKDSIWLKLDSTTILSAIVITDSSGCSDTNRSDAQVIVISEMPQIQFDTIVSPGADVILPFEAFPSYRFNWTPDSGLSCTDCNFPKSVYILNQRNYRVDFEETWLQCFKGKSTFEIRVFPDISINVPTAFTPNGDGFNDIMYARGFGIKKLEFFKIYNRQGQLLFHTINENIGWDGTFKGALQPQDVYYYHLKGSSYIIGKEISKEGSFMLLK